MSGNRSDEVLAFQGSAEISERELNVSERKFLGEWLPVLLVVVVV